MFTPNLIPALLLLLIPLVHSSPTPGAISAREDSAAATESWVIHEMEENFLTGYTGSKGNTGPGSASRDNSLGFVITFPTGNAKCHADWPTSYDELSVGTLPPSTRMFDCELENSDEESSDAGTPQTRANEKVQFALKKHEDGKQNRAEMGFVVMIIRTVGDIVTYGEAEITTSDPSSSNGENISITAREAELLDLSDEQKLRIVNTNLANGNLVNGSEKEELRVYNLGIEVEVDERPSEGLEMGKPREPCPRPGETWQYCEAWICLGFPPLPCRWGDVHVPCCKK